MNGASQFLVNHGLPVLFVAVLLEQLGLPLPCFPWLLAAGALAASGKLNYLLVLAVVMLGCLLADSFWFYIGRFRGARVLGLLCRISLQPDSCVRRTQNVFTRWGMAGLLVAKFVPGLNSVAPPLAAMSGVPYNRFLLVDAAGSLFYASVLTGLGYGFSDQIGQLGASIARIGGNAFTVFAVAAVAYIGFKFWQRKRLLNELRTSRITVAELRQKMDAGENPVILDLRSAVELKNDPAIIQGAVHMELHQIGKNSLPHDREIILYCSCPNEITSARVAMTLHRQGYTRIRPLRGGIAAWRELNYPTDMHVIAVAATITTVKSV